MHWSEKLGIEIKYKNNCNMLRWASKTKVCYLSNVFFIQFV